MAIWETTNVEEIDQLILAITIQKTATMSQTVKIMNKTTTMVTMDKT